MLAPRDTAAAAAAAAAAVAAAAARPPPNPLAGLPGAALLRALRLADDALAQGRHADAVLVYRGVRPWPEARALPRARSQRAWHSEPATVAVGLALRRVVRCGSVHAMAVAQLGRCQFDDDQGY